MKKLYLIIIIILTICLIYDEYIIDQPQDRSFYDMPDEFNIETTSKDRKNPTMMMVVYDTTYNMFKFEYVDK